MRLRPYAISADVLDWLLEPDNASVRYLTLHTLLHRPAMDSDILTTRAAIARSSIVQHIFARQSPAGYWGDLSSPYEPKYKSTYWSVMLLGCLGLSRDDERVQRAVEHIFLFQQPEGGFSETGSAGALLKFRHAVQRQSARGKPLPQEGPFVADWLHQMTFSCLTGNLVTALLHMGYGDDPRVWHAIEWLIRVQNADGGWLCPYWKAHVRDKHACFYGTICALEALSEIPESQRTPAQRTASVAGAEFLLMHRLYRSDHHDWQVINPHWLTLSFPFFWGYNILRGLWVLTRLGYHDERMSDALDVLHDKRQPDGRWMLEAAPWDRMQANLERRDEASKWITCMACYVLAEF